MLVPELNQCSPQLIQITRYVLKCNGFNKCLFHSLTLVLTNDTPPSKGKVEEPKVEGISSQPYKTLFINTPWILITPPLVPTQKNTFKKWLNKTSKLFYPWEGNRLLISMLFHSYPTPPTAWHTQHTKHSLNNFCVKHMEEKNEDKS